MAKGLSVTVQGKALVVRMPIDALVVSAEHGPLWPGVKVLDAAAFARDVAANLASDEDEEGLTPLMRAFDRAMEAVVEDCSPSVSYDETAWEKV